MKRILMLGLLALSLLCGTAFAKTGEGMTIWFDTGGSVGDGYGTIVQNGAKAAAAMRWCKHASDHAASVSTKPWKYLLVPHDEVSESKRLADYLRFEVKAN